MIIIIMFFSYSRLFGCQFFFFRWNEWICIHSECESCCCCFLFVFVCMTKLDMDEKKKHFLNTRIIMKYREDVYSCCIFFFFVTFCHMWNIHIYLYYHEQVKWYFYSFIFFYLITSGFIIVIIKIVKNFVFVCFFFILQEFIQQILSWLETMIIESNGMMNMANELSRSLTFADMVNQAWLFFLFSFFFSQNYVEFIKFCPTKWLKVFTFFFILKILKIQRWSWWWLA